VGGFRGTPKICSGRTWTLRVVVVVLYSCAVCAVWRRWCNNIVIPGARRAAGIQQAQLPLCDNPPFSALSFLARTHTNISVIRRAARIHTPCSNNVHRNYTARTKKKRDVFFVQTALYISKNCLFHEAKTTGDRFVLWWCFSRAI